MWIHEVAPERLAELFHHYHQALTPEISGKGSEGRGSWKEVTPQEKNRLVAAARLALLELASIGRRTGKGSASILPSRAKRNGAAKAAREMRRLRRFWVNHGIGRISAFTNSLGIS